jgi:hypothetical protein
MMTQQRESTAMAKPVDHLVLRSIASYPERPRACLP